MLIDEMDFHKKTIEDFMMQYHKDVYDMAFMFIGELNPDLRFGLKIKEQLLIMIQRMEILIGETTDEDKLNEYNIKLDAYRDVLLNIRLVERRNER